MTLNFLPDQPAEDLSYRAFLEAKKPIAALRGFDIDPSEVNPLLKPHQRDIVVWAVRGGSRAIFAAFGLGKTVIQLEIVRLVLKLAAGGRALIVLPLGVRQEFMRDAAMLGIPVIFIRSTAEASADGIYLTNYESVRDGKLDPSGFVVVSLDEAAILRSFGGTKTFREFMRLFEAVRYRFVATATPSPNEYVEMLAYAAFLGVMDVGAGKTRFFKRNSEKADELTLHEHKADEFWLWCSTWAVFVQKPSDLGYSDEGYELPPLDLRWHELPADHAGAGAERDGQQRLFRNAAAGVSEAAKEKRDTLPARIERLMAIRSEDFAAHRILWHDLEAERKAIETACPAAVSVYGSQDLDEREQAIIDFSEGRIAELAAKPVMLGSGCNLQRHCAWAVFLGIGFKFKDFIQAIHRLQRFGQTRTVRVDLIYSAAEREIRRSLEEKWARHREQAARMAEIIRRYGLAKDATVDALERSIGCERVEASGERWRLVNADAVEEAARLPDASVDLILTSIPFGTQYEYTPSYNDFGHTDDNAHFWRQMDYLTPHLLRVLKPGRNAVIHVKDRIVPGGINGLGFQTVEPFSDDCSTHFRKHGFALLRRLTVTTDVVRENNQTDRLGWSEQCKDGSRMGGGMSEYLLFFRKPQTDTSRGYADEPVIKAKPLCDDHGEPAPFDKKRNWRKPLPGTGYSRGRWQIDASGYWRSSGDCLLTGDELRNLQHDQLYKLWKARSTDAVYDHAAHVEVTEQLDRLERLPSTFMLLPPHSTDPDVWSDVARMRTLNMTQKAKGREMHLCPLQLDIVERVIRLHSMEGETVLDPFAGIGTVPFLAVKMRRRPIGFELNPEYFRDAIGYAEAAERDLSTVTLFDLMAVEQGSAAA